MASRKPPQKDHPEKGTPDGQKKPGTSCDQGEGATGTGEGFEQLALFGERPDRRRREWRRD